MDLPRIRRVVTGHDDEGKAVVFIDEVCTQFTEGRPNGFVCNVWATETVPANNNGHDDTGRPGKFAHGSVFRLLDFRPGLAQRIHRTDTIDYIVVMQGEIDMELEPGGPEVHLKAGDVMVQRGTVHNWINRGTERCLLAVILIEAKPVEAGGKTLAAFG